jgi:hypothetical protein
MRSVEIFFDDLKPEAQQRVLRELRTTVEEENWDVFPLTTLEVERDDDNLLEENYFSCEESECEEYEDSETD